MARRKKHARQERPKTPPRKKALFAIIAIAAFFLLLELGLFFAGIEPLVLHDDPYLGFASSIPLFVEDEEAGGTDLVTAPNRARWFNPQRFPKAKPTDTYRIFTLGGSTTYGRPYSDNVSFSGWLREILPAADPSKQWEVINAGGISYASYRVAVVMEELAAYEPDLFVIYTGHNEFLERRTYPDAIETPSALTTAAGVLSRTRIFSAGDQLVRTIQGRPRAAAGQRPVLATEVDTILANTVGPEAYHRDEAGRAKTLAHFRFNLQRMIRLAGSAGAAVVLVTPAANLKDSAPFKSEPGPGVAFEDRRRLVTLFESALEAASNQRWQDALLALDEAVTLDGRYAAGHYHRGRALFSLGRYADAKTAFLRALEEDVCPLRALPEIQQIITEIAAEQDVPLVDFQQLIEQQADHEIPGSDEFLDHVHPTLTGHRLLALELLKVLEQRGIASRSGTWGDDALTKVSERVEGRLDRKTHGAALRNLARLSSWLGRFDEASRTLAKAGELLGPDAETLDLMGQNAAAHGQLEEAIALYRRAVEINPNYADAHLHLGTELVDQGSVPEGLSQLQRALALDPDSAEAHTELGIALGAQGNRDQAIQQYRRALALRPRYAIAHNNLGIDLAAQGDVAQGISHLQEALRIDSGYVDALINLGYMYAARGDYGDAIPLYVKAIGLKPDSFQAHFNLGSAQHQMGQSPQAVNSFVQALRIDPSSAPGHFSLGVALVGAGRQGQGLAHIRKAATLDARFIQPLSEFEKAIEAGQAPPPGSEAPTPVEP
ncbi:MAG: tetratricopeptide repeat protein [Acidobacteria bacterium]|nr:tetratricopeptide repeat protein [Acidobacteriota bacterium]